MFTANPSTLTRLDLEGELRSITDELDQVGLRGVLRFQCEPAATPAAVQRALLMDRPTVVQFSGHGRGSGRRRRASTHGRRDLVVEDEPVGATGIMMHGDARRPVKVVSGAALGDLFAKAGSSVRLVFLNTCHSEEQADALIEHVDFVVGVDGAISDEAARVFATAMYRGLAFGRSVRAAFDLGVTALKMEGLEDDWALPVLSVRPGADPKATTFVDAPKRRNEQAWDAFVSYANTDFEPVRCLAEALHKRQLEIFLDEWEILLGEEEGRKKDDGIRGSAHGILALSPQTMTHPWVEAEYAALLEKAVSDRRRLIPVLVGEGDAQLPPFLRARRYVDLRGKSGAAYEREVESIALALRGIRRGPPPR
ncbi:MAG: TIR domain-containing protein [Myxococcota bacterium]